MNQDDNSMLSEFDHLLGLSPSTVDTSAFSAAPDPTCPGFRANYPYTRSQTGLSQHNLAAFNSLFGSHDDALAKAVAAKPESSCHTTTTSSRPRFVPPKGPRKQHRSGFRQLPGANGVVKRGRPSKNEYKLAGIEVDMYALKGVTLNGPVKSLAEVKGGEVVAKRAIRRGTRKSSTRNPKGPVSASARAKSGTVSQAIQEEALVAEHATTVTNQSYRDSQDVLFSSTQESSTYNHNQLSEPNIENLTQPSPFQSLSDHISSLLNIEYDNGLMSHQNLGYSQWNPNSMADPGVELSNGSQSLTGLQQLSNFQQQLSYFPAHIPPQPSSFQADPNLDPSLSLPWPQSHETQFYTNPSFGLDDNPNPQTTVYNEYVYPSVFQNFPL